MTKAELKKKLFGATYFRDGEGKLKIIKLYEDRFAAEDSTKEVHILFYVDYAESRQPFEIIKE